MKKFISLILILLLCTACTEPVAGEPQEALYSDRVSVVFITVGSADSILLVINDKSYLIDTGRRRTVPAMFRALGIMGVEQIDGLFLTHTHSDHIGGVEALVKRFPVKMLYSAEITMLNKRGEDRFVNMAQEFDLPHTKLVVGDQVIVEDHIIFEVLGPLEYNDYDDNDNSLILMITLNGKRFLFTGDLQFAGERLLLDNGTDLKADVLKVGNHGNPDATSAEFAKAVSPDYAIITTDITEDRNSANPLVINNLRPAQVMSTHQYIRGIKLDVDIYGNISISELQAAEKTADMAITGIDNENQTVTIKNNGEKTDISGFFIFSERGSEIFIFPEGSMIDPGQIITIACLGGSGDYIWNETNVWHRKNPDTGILYDRFGNELSRKR